jgi:hypothetical protein
MARGLPSKAGEEDAVMSCDYNGWNDAPEDEREALDAYEAAAEKATASRRTRQLSPRRSSISRQPW